MGRQFKLIGAFATIYFVWGSTFLAIKMGIETMPPFLMMVSYPDETCQKYLIPLSQRLWICLQTYLRSSEIRCGLFI